MKHTIFTLLFIYLFTTVKAQQPENTALQSINRSSAEAIIGFLASDLLEGREAGERGAQISAEYIISLLKLYGIKPYNGNYLQPFEGKYSKTVQYNTPEENQNRTSETKVSVKAPMNNVLGMIEGKNSNEYVIIGAHYDHLGMNPLLEGDKIYNGADDNASGVSAVLQIARAFQISGIKPDKNIIFAFWDGEEKKLLGSAHFVETFPDLSQIKCYLNFDMIGRNKNEDKPTEVVYFYTRPYAEFEEWLKADIETHLLNITPNYRAWDEPTSGSDNASFARRGIPIIWFHTDGHPDYHQPTDHPDKLNWEKIVDITKAAFLISWKLANHF